MSEQVQDIPLSNIVTGENDRTVFDEKSIAALAELIREQGLIQPITVRPQNGHYEIVAGERRSRACALLEWKTIPAIVRPLSDEIASKVMLSENMGRENLNPIDEANAYQKRMNQFGWSAAEIAKDAGVSKKRVEQMVTLLNLIDDIQALVRNKQLKLGFAYPMTKLDANRQLLCIRFLNGSKKITVSMFKAFVEELYAEQSQAALFDFGAWEVKAQELEAWSASGKKANVPVPRNAEIPQPVVDSGCTAGMVAYKYIVELQEAGHTAEAAAIGNLFTALLRSNFVAIPKLPDTIYRDGRFVPYQEVRKGVV